MERLYTTYNCPQCGAAAREAQSVPGSYVCTRCGLRFGQGAERLPRARLARLRARWRLLGDVRWVIILIAIAAILVLAPPYFRHFSWPWAAGSGRLSAPVAMPPAPHPGGADGLALASAVTASGRCA